MSKQPTILESTFRCRPTYSDLQLVDAELGKFPDQEIESRLNGIGLSITASQIPKNFGKYFALIRVLTSNAVGSSLLDFGSGLGVFISQASILGMKAEGLDVFTEYDNRCYDAACCIASCIAPTSRPPVMTRLDFLKEDVPRQVDFVTSFGMLEHIHGASNRGLILKRMVDALKPGGHLILTCGPNRRFPIDFSHYGPRFVFYHQLPVSLRRLYLKLFAKQSECQDPTWLQGMSVPEICSSLHRCGAVQIEQLFPLWIDLARGRMRNRIFRSMVMLVAKVLIILKAEPVIILVARKGKN